MIDLVLASLSPKDFVSSLVLFALSAYCFLAAHMEMRGLVRRRHAEKILETHGPGRLQTLNRIGGVITLVCGASFLLPNFGWEPGRRAREETRETNTQVTRSLNDMTNQRLARQTNELLSKLELGETYPETIISSFKEDPRKPRPSPSAQAEIRDLLVKILTTVAAESITSAPGSSHRKSDTFTVFLYDQEDSKTEGGRLILYPEQIAVEIKTPLVSKNPRTKAKPESIWIRVPGEFENDFRAIEKMDIVAPVKPAAEP